MILGTATSYLNLSNLIVALAEARRVTEAAIDDGGTGYVVGDILTVVGGTAIIAAQLEVTSESGGVIDGIRVYNNGGYTADPTDPVSVTGGSGTGAEFNLTLAENGWEVERDQVYTGSDREVVLKGSGGGTDEIFIGWRTFQNVGLDYYNWELHGMFGYNDALPFKEQPGISPGFYDEASPSFYGAYLLGVNVSFNFFLNITPYRIILTIAAGGAYHHHYLGWGNRYATDTEYPYPMIVAGSGATFSQRAAITETVSSLTDPWAQPAAATSGPMLITGFDNQWLSVQNRRATSVQRNLCVSPAQVPAAVASGPAPEDLFATGTSWPQTSDFIFSISTGSGGTMSVTVLPTPGDNDRVLFPTVIIMSSPSFQVFSELDEVFWVSAFGGLTSGDRIIQGDDVYRVFQNGNRTELYSFLAIKE